MRDVDSLLHPTRTDNHNMINDTHYWKLSTLNLPHCDTRTRAVAPSDMEDQGIQRRLRILHNVNLHLNFLAEASSCLQPPHQPYTAQALKRKRSGTSDGNDAKKNRDQFEDTRKDPVKSGTSCETMERQITEMSVVPERISENHLPTQLFTSENQDATSGT